MSYKSPTETFFAKFTSRNHIAAITAAIALSVIAGAALLKGDNVDEDQIAELMAKVERLESGSFTPNQSSIEVSPPLWGDELRAELKKCLGGEGVTNHERDGCLMYFYGSLAGINAVYSMSGIKPPFCLTSEIDDATLIRAIGTALDRYSEASRVSAPGALVLALEATLPCPIEPTAPVVPMADEQTAAPETTSEDVPNPAPSAEETSIAIEPATEEIVQ